MAWNNSPTALSINDFPEELLDAIADKVVDKLMAIFAEHEGQTVLESPRRPGPGDADYDGLSADEVRTGAVERFAKDHPELARLNPVEIISAYIADRNTRRRRPAATAGSSRRGW